MDSGGTLAIKENCKTKINKSFIGNLLISMQEKIYALSRGHAQKNLDTKEFKKLKIPLPPLKVQKEIVAEIETEQKAVEECKKLIGKNERKIADKISEVWK